MSSELHEETAGGGGGHETGGMMRWLLTYADMITLLMAFFIMMYSMSVISVEKFKQAAAGLRSEFGPPSTEGNLGGGSLLPHPRPMSDIIVPPLEEDLQSVRDKLQEYIQQNDLQDVIHTSHEARGLIITLVSDNLLFPVGEAVLRAPALSILDQIAGLLGDIPNLVVIEGHTCSLPISTPRYPSNWELSAARACAVVRYLIERWGVEPLRLAATAYADSRPVGSNEREEGRTLNRRVEVVILAHTTPPAADALRSPAEATGEEWLREELRSSTEVHQ
jgi:chemotaxis protein MotB